MENYALLIRKMFAEGDASRDAGLISPDDVIRYDDIVYGSDPQWNVLDVYRPKGADGLLLPVIVNVHGGGMVYGSKEVYQYYCMSLAQQGFAVVNYTYRLAPENKFPAALEDCCHVFQWVLDKADAYGFDCKHIFAVGDSAGGTILGQFCNLCTNPEYAAKLPSCKAPEGFVLEAVALNCGDYKYSKPQKEEEGLIKSLLPYIFENGGTPEEIALGSVIGNVTSRFPCTYLMSSQMDFLKDQMLMMTKEFIDHDVSYISAFYVDPTQELGHVFHCNIKLDIAGFCNREQTRFFKLFADRKS